MNAVGASALDPAAERLLNEGRERQRSTLQGHERFVRWVSAIGLVVVAVPLALLAPTVRHPSPWAVAALITAFALASRVEFEVGSGSTIPTEIVSSRCSSCFRRAGFRSPYWRRSSSRDCPTSFRGGYRCRARPFSSATPGTRLLPPPSSSPSTNLPHRRSLACRAGRPLGAVRRRLRHVCRPRVVRAAHPPA